MSGRGGRALGLDVGERRIGVAIADELGAIASPLATVQRRAGDLREIRDIAIARSVDHVVVGLPTGLSGREGPQAASVRAFAAALQDEVGSQIEVVFWDERLSTAVAERALLAHGTKRAQRKERVDAVAAAVILQGYLDARRARALRTGTTANDDAG